MVERGPTITRRTAAQPGGQSGGSCRGRSVDRDRHPDDCGAVHDNNNSGAYESSPHHKPSDRCHIDLSLSTKPGAGERR